MRISSALFPAQNAQQNKIFTKFLLHAKIGEINNNAKFAF